MKGREEREGEERGVELQARRALAVKTGASSYS
jgi:hypothetical protein